MIKKVCNLFLVVLIAAAFNNSNAQDSDNTEDRRSRVAWNVSLGYLKNANTNETEDLNAYSSAHHEWTYDYHITQHFSVGLSYITGLAEGAFIFDISDSELDYSSILYNAILRRNLSERISVYARVSALDYDWDILDDGIVVSQSTGTDFGWSIGCSYSWESGIGINGGIEKLNFGSALGIRNLILGLSYNF